MKIKYRRVCQICKKKIIVNDKRIHTCQNSPECQSELRRLARIRNAHKYKAGGKYYYYRKRNRKVVIIPGNPDIKMRYCLGVLCNGEKKFLSKGKFRRICNACTKASAGRNVHVHNNVVTPRGENSWREHF